MLLFPFSDSGSHFIYWSLEENYIKHELVEIILKLDQRFKIRCC